MKEIGREKQQSRDQLGQRVNTMSSGQIKNIENETCFFFFLMQTSETKLLEIYSMRERMLLS